MYVPPLCHLCGRGFLRSSYLGPYSEDILIRHCSILCELLVGNPLRHLSEVGCSRKAKGPFDQSLEAWNIKSEPVGCFQCYLKREGNARKGRDVEEGKKQAASGMAARSSRLLRCCSSRIHHLQNYPCVTTDTRFRGSLWSC